MLNRWSRFPSFPSDWNRLRDEMERAFSGGDGSMAHPAINLWEDDDNLFVETEVPGLELGDLEIFVNGGDQLTIQGERKQPNGKIGSWHRQECSYGKFSRMVRLPSDVDADRVAAEFVDGVLSLTLPKKEEARPRRIEVTAN